MNEIEEAKKLWPKEPTEEILNKRIENFVDGYIDAGEERICVSCGRTRCGELHLTEVARKHDFPKPLNLKVVGLAVPATSSETGGKYAKYKGIFWDVALATFIFAVLQTIATLIGYFIFVWVFDITGYREFAQLVSGVIIGTPPVSLILKGIRWYLISKKKNIIPHNETSGSVEMEPITFPSHPPSTPLPPFPSPTSSLSRQEETL